MEGIITNLKKNNWTWTLPKLPKKLLKDIELQYLKYNKIIIKCK